MQTPMKKPKAKKSLKDKPRSDKTKRGRLPLRGFQDSINFDSKKSGLIFLDYKENHQTTDNRCCREKSIPIHQILH